MDLAGIFSKECVNLQLSQRGASQIHEYIDRKDLLRQMGSCTTSQITSQKQRTQFEERLTE